MSPTTPSRQPRAAAATTAYRPDIDGLRAIAVTSVLLFHLGLRPFQGGFVGVDIFFVISGFLITGIIKSEIQASGRFRFGAFYMRRVRRLFPALLATLVLSSIAAILLLSPVHLKGFGASVAATLASVSNIYFWQEADYFDLSAKVKPLLHTWSLSVEEQFYLLWPLFLLLLIRSRPARLAPWVVMLVALLSLAANIPIGKGGGGDWNVDGHSTIFYLLPFRVFELGMGALLVWVADLRPSRRNVDELVFWIGLLLMGYAVLRFDSEMLFPSYFALAPCLGAACVIYSGGRAASAALITSPPVVWTGLVSYSLYLVHWPLIVFWQYVGGELGWSDRVFIVAIAMLLASASYRYIERPFRTRKFDIALPAWRYPAIAGGIAVAALGTHMHLRDGWAWRAPPASVAFDYVGDAANFHRKFYGGAGFPGYGPFQTNGRADIVVMVDSHGKQYAEGVYRILAQPKGLALYISAGTSCFHLPGFTRLSTGQDWDTMCRDRLEKSYEFVRRGNKPLVLVAHAWALQQSRGGLLDAHGRRLQRRVEAADIVAGILALKEGIADSPLVVIGEAPKAGENLYDVFTRPRPPFGPVLDPRKFLSTRELPADVEFNAVLKKAALRSGKFTFVDPHDVLCRNGVCRNTNSRNQLLYSDASHLSKSGSMEVIEGFLPQLQAANRLRKPGI